MRTALLFILIGWFVAQQAAPTAAQVHSTHPPGAQMPASPPASPVLTPPPSMGTPSHAPAAPPAGPLPAAEGTTTLSNLAERSGWPSPVADSASYVSFAKIRATYISV